MLALLLATSSAADAGPSDIFRGAGPDFAAFYCSGYASAHHQNPYLVEPLRSCEGRVQPSPGRSSSVVDPSPLPGYDLALFGLLARLPYELAKILWFLALFASIGLATVATARLTRLPAIAVFVFLLAVDGVLNLSYGQIPPLVVAAVAVAAYFVERKRYVWAAVVASSTMIEPNVGLPACLAMMLFLPRCRLSLAVAAGVLAFVALIVGGVGQNLAYFTTYLPAQARAELVATDQFSLSALLHLVGVPDRMSLLLGSISYIGMLCLGVYLARRAARAYASDAFYVLLPPAAALLGGSYVHDVQFAAALPAALLLFAKTKPSRYVPWIAVSLLVFPWFSYSSGGHFEGAAIRAIGFIATLWLAAIALSSQARRARLVGVAGAAFAFVALLFAFAHARPSMVASQSAIPDALQAPDATASADWGAYLRATPSLSMVTPGRQLEKVPFWLGILLILFEVARTPIPADAPSESIDQLPRRKEARDPLLASSRTAALDPS